MLDIWKTKCQIFEKENVRYLENKCQIFGKQNVSYMENEMLDI